MYLKDVELVELTPTGVMHFVNGAQYLNATLVSALPPALLCLLLQEYMRLNNDRDLI